MYAVEVTPEFIKNLQANNNVFSLTGDVDPVSQFKPPRPWHPEKYKTFLKNLAAQASKKQ